MLLIFFPPLGRYRPQSTQPSTLRGLGVPNSHLRPGARDLNVRCNSKAAGLGLDERCNGRAAGSGLDERCRRQVPVSTNPGRASPAQPRPPQARPAQARPPQARPDQPRPAQASPGQASPAHATPGQPRLAQPRPRLRPWLLWIKESTSGCLSSVGSRSRRAGASAALDQGIDERWGPRSSQEQPGKRSRSRSRRAGASAASALGIDERVPQWRWI